MALLNLSRNASTKDLTRLLAFITQAMDTLPETLVSVSDDPPGRIFARGRADELATVGGSCHFVARVWLSQGYSYPRTSYAVPQLPPIRVYSWEEEFVLVLAHELRHLVQFQGRMFLVHQVQKSEIDAEVVARRVLKQYRTWIAQEQDRAA